MRCKFLSIIQMRKRAFSGIIVLAGLMGYSLLTNVAFMTAEPSPFQLQPVWELRARAVADSCGYRFRSGSELSTKFFTNFPFIIGHVFDPCFWVPPTLDKMTRTEYEFLMNHLLVSEKTKLIFCYIPKVGCSNWKRILSTIEGHQVRKLAKYTRREQAFMVGEFNSRETFWTIKKSF